MTGPKINLRYANSECSAKGPSLKSLESFNRLLVKLWNFAPGNLSRILNPETISWKLYFQTWKGMWKIFTPADGSSFDKPDAILGPVCKNAVEPALRYAEVHNVSVITPGAQGAAFDRGDGFSERIESTRKCLPDAAIRGCSMAHAGRASVTVWDSVARFSVMTASDDANGACGRNFREKRPFRK